ncbi:hypothetical protein [Shewanella dokdonensis]|nr:hypothetical protein [Shewanella dokdonensis]
MAVKVPHHLALVTAALDAGKSDAITLHEVIDAIEQSAKTPQ